MPKKDIIFDLIAKEKRRQRMTLMMIPSENYTCPEVRKAVGSILMQKYAEGQPKKRYYQGMQFSDEIELLCEERALQAFDLNKNEWGANVQPHSGCPANLAVYNALLEPGDKILSMYLNDGGHLSHGWHTPDKKITFVSKVWNVEFYKVNPRSRLLDYDQIEKQAVAFKPKLIVSGGTAYPREINHKRLSEIAHKLGAYYLADVAHEAGLIAGGANSSPFPYADVVTMTTHKTLRGPRGAIIIAKKELLEKIDSSVFPGLQGGPHIHSIAGIAIALAKTKTPEFKRYTKKVVENAKLLASELSKKGFDVVSGGTDKHLILIDLRDKNINGWLVAWALEEAGIIVNRNTVPNETASAFYPSGLRFGTPAITVRGMGKAEMIKIADLINKVVEHLGSKSIPENPGKRKEYLSSFLAGIKKDSFLKKVRKEVLDMCRKFPVL
ncbi:serine hydroxymethyltransferase [Candidatus Woesebacteria bacterium]|nr:serine hydroxymethyltransferase [Candidatus Woesebacteria bacterium]